MDSNSIRIDKFDICFPTINTDLVDGVSNGRSQLIQILDSLPKLVYLKDANTRKYIWCNKKFADFLNLKNQKEITGKLSTDFIKNVAIYDLNNLEQSKKLEDEAIVSKKIFKVEKQVDLNHLGTTIITGTIIPILNNDGNVDSILCYGSPFMLISDKSLTNAFKAINKVNIPKIVHKPKYPINTPYGKVKLSRRETQCILYMIKGLTTKEVAVYMDVSRKTVEKYIESVKSKTGCNSRSELISTVVDGGLLENL
jgi:DNA-binding CsgD family transcriptional regulator